MGYNLFLDDVRMPKDTFDYMKLPIYISVDWSIVRNYYAFKAIVEGKGIPEIVSFDHDLADEHYDPKIVGGESYEQIYDMFDEKTGYHCAKWLIDYCIGINEKLPTEIFIHSMNPAGSMNIKSLFDTYSKVFGERVYVYMLPSSRR
jgi:hypothetical protein